MSNYKLNSSNSKLLPCYKCGRVMPFFKLKSTVAGDEELVLCRCAICHTLTIPKKDKAQYLEKLRKIGWNFSKSFMEREAGRAQISLV